MDRSLLVRLFGFPSTLIHGDTLVYDRWRWLRTRLPRVADGVALIDVGCGTGAFTIGAAKRGYRALGLSWDVRNQTEASRRAVWCGAANADFAVCDVRTLDEHSEYRGQFDVALCLETIEHVLDDFRLMRAIAGCLKPGGRLLLTTPYFHYRAITASDDGPFSDIENGWHVRRGYTSAMLQELCQAAGLVCEEISYCSGLLSQKATALMRVAGTVNPLLGWGAVLPLRPLVPWFDPLLSGLFHWPYYSIGLEAYKPRTPIGDVTLEADGSSTPSLRSSNRLSPVD